MATRLGHVTELPEGLGIHVPHVKGDQLGRGADVRIRPRPG